MNVVFEITTDPQLLNQYYKLRETSFKKILRLPDFCGQEEELDRQSDILIARVGTQCLGGVRICGVDESDLLPLESHRHDLPSQLPDLNLDQYGYCQWMRLTMCSDTLYPNEKLHQQFFLALTKFSVSLGYRYGFCLSSKVHQRFYKKFFSQYDCNYWSCEGINVASESKFNDLEHLLCVTDMHSLGGDDFINSQANLNATYHLNNQIKPPLYYCKS